MLRGEDKHATHEPADETEPTELALARSVARIGCLLGLGEDSEAASQDGDDEDVKPRNLGNAGVGEPGTHVDHFDSTGRAQVREVREMSAA